VEREACIPPGAGLQSASAEPSAPGCWDAARRRLFAGPLRQTAAPWHLTSLRPHFPKPAGCQAGTLRQRGFKAELATRAVPSRRSPQHPSPLQQRHQNHLKNSSRSKGILPAQLLSSPGPAAVVLLGEGTMLARRWGSRDGIGQEDPAPAAAPGEWQPCSFQGAAGSIAPWSPQSRSSFPQSLRRAGGPAYVTTGCPRREGDTALPVHWETPVIEIFQPGAISSLSKEKWRREAPGKRAQSITPCCVLCPKPSPTNASWQQHYQDAVTLVQRGVTHWAETCGVWKCLDKKVYSLGCIFPWAGSMAFYSCLHTP